MFLPDESSGTLWSTKKESLWGMKILEEECQIKFPNRNLYNAFIFVNGKL